MGVTKNENTHFEIWYYFVARVINFLLVFFLKTDSLVPAMLLSAEKYIYYIFRDFSGLKRHVSLCICALTLIY